MLPDSNAAAISAGPNFEFMLAQAITNSSQDKPGKSQKQPPPDIDYIIAVPNIFNTLEIFFYPINTGGSVNTWSWNFGDGGTSNVQNPSHTYAAGKKGTVERYTVTLRASGPGGTDTKSIQVSVLTRKSLSTFPFHQ